MIRLFSRNPGRDLARIGAEKRAAAAKERRQTVREQVDLMRADMRLPPVKWPRLA